MQTAAANPPAPDPVVYVRGEGAPVTAPVCSVALVNELHVLLRHRLLPFLREAFGGSAGLVLIAIVCDTHDQAICPHRDGCVAQLNFTVAASRTALLDDDRRPAFDAWLDRKPGGVTAGIRRDAERWLRTLKDGGPRSRPRTIATVHSHLGKALPALLDWSAIAATTALESIPPERNAPSGTSLTRRMRVASQIRSRNRSSNSRRCSAGCAG